MEVSVIIPTLNGYRFIEKTIRSVFNQTLSRNNYEVIVVDNGSKHKTSSVIQTLSMELPFRYVYEPKSGLQHARHRGALEARGEILIYFDDDIVVDKHCLENFLLCFNEKNIGVVGGKISPLWWKVVPPSWVEDHIDYLSIVDYCEEICEASNRQVYGCNFAIRKEVLIKAGGFNPDLFPWEMIEYRGDGESGLIKKVMDLGYKILYTPFAQVNHIIPPERVTLQYFKKRFFMEGISNSFTFIRENGFQNKMYISFLCFVRKQFFSKSSFQYIFRKGIKRFAIKVILESQKRKGILYHRKRISFNPDLLRHIETMNFWNAYAK